MESKKYVYWEDNGMWIGYLEEYPDYMSQGESLEELKENDILITADTIVWLEGKALGKPKNKEEANEMLRSLSNKSHEVISSIALTTIHEQFISSEKTTVRFKELTDQKIPKKRRHHLAAGNRNGGT